MDQATRIGFGILLGLDLSGAAVIVLVVALDVAFWVGLVVLAVLELVVVVVGYTAVKRASRRQGASPWTHERPNGE